MHAHSLVRAGKKASVFRAPLVQSINTVEINQACNHQEIARTFCMHARCANMFSVCLSPLYQQPQPPISHNIFHAHQNNMRKKNRMFSAHFFFITLFLTRPPPFACCLFRSQFGEEVNFTHSKYYVLAVLTRLYTTYFLFRFFLFFILLFLVCRAFI